MAKINPLKSLANAGTGNLTNPVKSVFITVTFLKISNIETVKEQFSADVFIKARWREPSLDHGNDISIVLTSEHPIQELEIIEDEQELSSLNVSCFVDVQEWELKDYVVTESKQMTKEFSRSKNLSFPLLTVKALAVRKYGFFVLNILVIMDIYISFCMIFNFCISIWHAVITRIEGYNMYIDGWAFITFLIIYCKFQLIYFGSVVGNYLWRAEKVRQKEQAYQRRAIKLNGESWKNSKSKVKDRRSAIAFW